MTPEGKIFADKLSIDQLLMAHARAHEIHMATMRGIARTMVRAVDLSKVPYLREALERVEGELFQGIPELSDMLTYLRSRIKRDLEAPVSPNCNAN